LSAEHVGRQVGDDDPPGGEPVPVGVKVGQPQVVRDVLVPVIRLGDEQVGIRGGIDEPVISPRSRPSRLRAVSDVAPQSRSTGPGEPGPRRWMQA
jgi:hypothetical protein